MPKERLVPTAEAAAILDCDTRTIHRMVYDGRLKAQTKFPGLRGAYVFDRTDVEKLRDQFAAEKAEASA